MNIFDYLKWRGDVPFSVAPFNEADNLILAELAYTAFEGIVPEDSGEISIRDAYDLFFRTHTRESILASKSYTARAPLLMEEMSGGARFGDTRLTLFRSEFDAQTDLQFGAVTFLLQDGTAYVAFRGTDGTLVGWKEDFNLSYLTGTEGQQRAAEYLNLAGEATGRPLRVGGHSKGGNLAVYAAACCREEVRKRITEVWSNDGPGFKSEFLAEEGYLDILHRIHSIIPDTSVIGLLMDSLAVPRVIKSTAAGIVKHDGFTWETEPEGFVSAELSRTSLLIRETLSGWLDQVDDEGRKAMTDTVFALLESTGEETFSGISGSRWKSLGAMASSARKMPKGSLQELGRVVTRLGQSGMHTASAYIQNMAAGRLQGIAAQETEKTEKDAEEPDT